MGKKCNEVLQNCNEPGDEPGDEQLQTGVKSKVPPLVRQKLMTWQLNLRQRGRPMGKEKQRRSPLTPQCKILERNDANQRTHHYQEKQNWKTMRMNVKLVGKSVVHT